MFFATKEREEHSAAGRDQNKPGAMRREGEKAIGRGMGKRQASELFLYPLSSGEYSRK
jgi:hypothetical protein